ncbi:hypothetical protein GCM10023223_40400 [Stackebrandtia albiflava]
MFHVTFGGEVCGDGPWAVADTVEKHRVTPGAPGVSPRRGGRRAGLREKNPLTLRHTCGETWSRLRGTSSTEGER